MERRKHKRVNVNIEVQYSSEHSFASDWITNISKGGMFIRTDHPLPPGTKLKISFSLPNRKLPIQVEGVVRWIAPREKGILPGMGVEITKISEEDKMFLEKFIDEVLAKEKLGSSQRK